jgi:hypothetical protein
MCCAVFLGSIDAVGQQRQTRTGPQLGTWKLQSYVSEDLTTGKKTDLFVALPSGYLSYGPDCRPNSHQRLFSERLRLHRTSRQPRFPAHACCTPALGRMLLFRPTQ